MPSDPAREFDAIISREVSRLDLRFDDLIRSVTWLIRAVMVLNVITGAGVVTAWLAWTFRKTLFK